MTHELPLPLSNDNPSGNHRHATPGSTLFGIARCIWRVTIDTLDIEGIMLDARKVAEDRTERSAAKRRYGSG